jgi:catechol 2,3-dioxygenase-like lactoylglutathione lyase family enzyme
MERPFGGLNHVSVVARDLQESVAFYVEVFGLDPVATPDFGFPVQWLLAGDRQLHLFERPDEPPATAHFSLELADPVPVYRVAKERGLLDSTTFGYAIAELPGGELQLYLRDPAGNLVEVNHPEAAALREEMPEMIVLAERLPQGPDNEGASLFAARTNA